MASHSTFFIQYYQRLLDERGSQDPIVQKQLDTAIWYDKLAQKDQVSLEEVEALLDFLKTNARLLGGSAWLDMTLHVEAMRSIAIASSALR